MTAIPFKQQRLALDQVAEIKRKLAQGSAASGEELLRAIEESENHQLDDDRIREIIRKFSVSAVRRRGRPTNSRGQDDFALEEVDALYPALLRRYEAEAEQKRLLAAVSGDVLPIAGQTPSELAYTDILGLERMKHLFPNLDWRTLRNKHSAWNMDHFHPIGNDTDSEDYEAEIERLFPSAAKSHLSG
jgi:hypothetical protein